MLNHDDLCEMIAERYYLQIYQFCFYRLQFDREAAEDCTQETFMVLVRKRSRLNLSSDLLPWLYRTAEHCIRNYLRREKKHHPGVREEEILLSDSGGLAAFTEDSPLDCLTEKERLLLQEYYDAAKGQRGQLAEGHGMTLTQLYKEISRIKEKVRTACARPAASAETDAES